MEFYFKLGDGCSEEKRGRMLDKVKKKSLIKTLQRWYWMVIDIGNVVIKLCFLGRENIIFGYKELVGKSGKGFGRNLSSGLNFNLEGM